MPSNIDIFRNVIIPFFWNSGFFSSSILRQNLVDHIFRSFWQFVANLFYQLVVEIILFFSGQILRFTCFFFSCFQFFMQLILNLFSAILQIIPFVFVSYFYKSTILINSITNFFEVTKIRIQKLRKASQILEKEKNEPKKHIYLTKEEKEILEKYFLEDSSPPSSSLYAKIFNETNLCESKVKNWWYRKRRITKKML